MSLKGTINSVSLSGVLQILSDNRATGILRVSSSKEEYQIYFLEGAIVFASESKKKSRLGSLLIKDGIININQLNESLETAGLRRVSLGKVLVGEDIISKKTLEKYIYKQVEDILYVTFLWKEGDFEFHHSKLILKWLQIIKLNTMGLILSASRRVDQFSQKQKSAAAEG